MTRTLRLALVALALASAVDALAQPDLMGGPRRRPPGFVRQLFAPQTIMRNQSELQLTEAQRTAITKEMKDFQASAVDLRWQIEEKSAALEKLLAADRVDEKAALAQGDELMRLEERMKRAHLGLLIRVKNVLTPEQQETLRKLRSERLRGRGGPGPRAGEEPPQEPLPDDE